MKTGILYRNALFIAVFILLPNLFHSLLSGDAFPAGKITSREGEKVTLNIGFNEGIKLGMRLSVFAREKSILLPLSNKQTLVNADTIIGEIQITKVEYSTSTGKILLEDNTMKIDSLCHVQEAEKQVATNHPPVISSLHLSSGMASPGKEVEVKAEVLDIDSDTLRYTWETEKGFFLSRNTVTPSNKLNIPFETGKSVISVFVEDGRGGIDKKQASFTIEDSDFQRNLGDFQRVRTFKNFASCGYGNLHIVDIDFDTNNNMYILDQNGRSIYVFDQNGRYLKTICKEILSSPNELMIVNNKIYVIYDKNTQVKRFNLNGNVEVTYSKTITADTKNNVDILKNAVAFTIGNEGELYVIDGEKPDIAVFESDGRFRLRFWNKQDNNKENIFSPSAICVDNNNYIYVCDSTMNEVSVYNQKMQFEKNIKQGKGVFADMYFDKIQSQFYLINAGQNNILRTDSTWKPIESFGKLRNPSRISMDIFHNVYVVDREEGHIYKYILNNNNFIYHGKFGNELFKDVLDIAVDNAGSIFLLNKQNVEIIKLDKDGWEQLRFGKKGYEDTDFKKPVSVVSGKGGEFIYVLDESEKKVFKFSNSGKFLGIVVSKNDHRIKNIIDIDSDNDGNIYILDSDADVCFVYNNLGKFLTQIGTKGQKKEYENLYKPMLLAAEPSGLHVYIFDNNPKLPKINVYKREGYDTYMYERYDKAPKGVNDLKVNNFNRLMVSYKHDFETDKIDIFKTNGGIDRTILGKESFQDVEDIEINNVENVYILNKSSMVHILKQKGLLGEK